MRKKHRLLKTVAIAGGSIAVLLATLQIAVNSRIADNFIDRFVAENVDGNLSYSAMHVSLIKAFPDIRVTIDSMALTYPHNRFSAYDDFGMKSVLKFSGCGEEIDTLAALRRFDVSVNPWKLLGSTVKLDKLQIDGLHLYAHEYGSSLANWKMFRFGAEEKEDAEKPLPDIYIGELSISDARNIVYSSIPSAMALRLSVDQLNLSGYRDYTMFLRSALLAQLPGISELDIPVQVDGIVGFRQNKGKMRFDLPSLDARIAHIPIHIEGNASVRDGSVPLDLNLEVKDCSIDSLLRVYVYKLAPATRDIKARAMLNLSARASGVYSKQSMPTVDASVSIPGGTVQYVPYGATGLLDLSAGVKDLLGEDPAFSVHGVMDAVLNSLSLPDEMGISTSGNMNLKLDADVKRSELEGAKFQKASVKAELSGDVLGFAQSKDSLKMGVFSPRIFAESGPEGLDIKMELDSLLFRKGAGMVARVRNMNNHGRVTKVMRRNSRVPKLELESFSSIFFQTGANRFAARDLDIAFTARKSAMAINDRAKAFLDSLQRVYPGVARADLLDEMRRHDSHAPLPSYLKDKEFEKGDINIQLDSALAGYLRQWNPTVRIALKQGFFATPYLPLRTRVNDFSGEFDGDILKLNSLKVTSGTSDVSVKGSVGGLRRALQSKGFLKADLDVRASRVNVNELVAAAYEGMRMAEVSSTAVVEENDESFVTDTLENADIRGMELPVLIIPANIIASLEGYADRVDIWGIEASPVSASASVQERTLQINRARVGTDIGNIDLTGYYSSRNKQSISAGVDLALEEVSVQDVLGMLPDRESLIPALKSLEGRVGCQLTATSQFDTLMRVIYPTVDGVVKVTGRDLNISDAGDLRKFTKLLHFADLNIGPIEEINISAVAHDNKVEVFPFEVGFDRFRVSIQGMQGFDRTLYYNLSLLKSPLPLNFGVDMYGTLDKVRFSPTFPKYRLGKVPQFEEELNAMKGNIRNSINDIFRQGSENIRRYNESARERLEKRKKALDYSMEASALSGENLAAVDSLSFAFDMQDYNNELEDEVQAVLDASYAETEVLLKKYTDTVYDKRALRKIRRIQRKQSK